ncbi:MAG: hypothetical protein J3K34DRAFT_456711 [Monoraphidium minutum]|nr:MAG: hypothetical protein J3K34DRAFT_456711 [Monoraphidium minutum]
MAVAGDAGAPYGYDVRVLLERGCGLLQTDWYGGGDPYVVIDIAAPGGVRLRYKTRTVWRQLDPVFDEWFTLTNAPPGTRLSLGVWDKDTLSPDDPMGSAAWTFDPAAAAAAAARPLPPAPPPPPRGPPPGSRQKLMAALEATATAAAAAAAALASTATAKVRAGAAGGPLGGAQGGGAAGAAGCGAACGVGQAQLSLVLAHPTQRGAAAGRLLVRVWWRPSEAPGTVRMRGPVRCRQNLSPLTGMVLGNWGATQIAHSTYKVFVHDVDAHFGGRRCPWNRGYAAAASIFTNPLVLASVKAQHASLYAQGSGLTSVLRTLTGLVVGTSGRAGPPPQPAPSASGLSRPSAGNGGGAPACDGGDGSSREWVVEDGEQLLQLLNYGERDGARHYFTYSLLPDSLRFSSTGAAFLEDVMSKHAMHATGAAEVVCAGEFTVLPRAQWERALQQEWQETVQGGPGAPPAPQQQRQGAAAPHGRRHAWRHVQELAGWEGAPRAAGVDAYVFVVDNNSGTYAPPGDRLPAMKALLEDNFPGLRVEAVDAVKRPRLLQLLHAYCPSRQPAATRARA